MSKDLSAEIGFSFEAVLEAVQESARGRWFLEELKKRSGQEDTTRLMDAITRIESRVEGMSGHFTAADDLAKVRQAIASTRSDIQKLAPAGEGLSSEARLFAHLADLARKSIPQDGPQAGVEKALRLVDQLDSSLNSNVMAFPTPPQKTADKYFQQDAALFEQKTSPAPAPAPIVAAAPAAKKPIVESVPLGAKLTITRMGKENPADEPNAMNDDEEPLIAKDVTQPAVVSVEAKPAPAVVEEHQPIAEALAPAAETPKPEAVSPTKPRIVIIRRKPEDIPEVPAVLAAPAA
jgi:hypothetical protein